MQLVILSKTVRFWLIGNLKSSNLDRKEENENTSVNRHTQTVWLCGVARDELYRCTGNTRCCASVVRVYFCYNLSVVIFNQSVLSQDKIIKSFVTILSQQLRLSHWTALFKN